MPCGPRTAALPLSPAELQTRREGPIGKHREGGRERWIDKGRVGWMEGGR